jgi:hypothetical protein
MKHRTAGLKCPPTPDSSKSGTIKVVYKLKKLAGPWIRDDITRVGDLIHHPRHYQSGSGLEVFDVIKAFAPKPNADHEVFLWGNAVKYILRYRKKRRPILDLQKAAVYIQELVRLLSLERDNRIIKADYDKRLKNRRTSTVGSLPTVSAKSKVQSVQPRTQSGHFMARKTTDKVVTRGSK